MTKILITGGTGFIGSRLALRLLEQGNPVMVLGLENNQYEMTNSRILKNAGVEGVIASVTDGDRMFEVLRDVDVVYHLAAAQHEANVPDQYFWDINFTGTQNLLRASLSAGVRRFVYGSTIGVYGSALDGVLDENSPTHPDSIYGITKLAAERLVLSYADVLPVVAIRISETYGPGDQRLLRMFRTIAKKRFPMIGDGENLHHPLFIEDLIDGLCTVASSERALGRVFVLPGKEPVTTNQMVEEIASQLGVEPPKLRLPMPAMSATARIMGKTFGAVGIQPPLHPRRLDFFRKNFVFSTTAASDTFGFMPNYSFSEGIQKTAAWYYERGYISSYSGNSTEKVHYSTDFPNDNTTYSGNNRKLTARMEPFDSFWEGPSDVEKGYKTLQDFYHANYMDYVPANKLSDILVISCGPGYFVNMLTQEGYSSVLGIDSDPRKVHMANLRGLNCVSAEAFPFLEEHREEFDLIFCESEINHLTKDEILEFFSLCRNSLKPGGTFICHSMNGANPITGAEGLALNIDHFNTFTDYSMRQLFEYADFRDIKIIPLNLYVFYKNPLNYVGIVADKLLTLTFRSAFIFYGKSNKLFTKKIAGIGRKPKT